MTDVFLSYAHQDQRRVKLLADALESQGFSVFLDQTLSPGEDFPNAIQNVLGQARCVIAVLTPASVDSAWVEKEIQFALRRDKRVIPVLLDDVEPPLSLRHINVADLRKWNGGADDPRLIRLLGEIRPVVGEESEPAIEKTAASEHEDTLTGPTKRGLRTWLARQFPRAAALGLFGAALYAAAVFTQAGLSKLTSDVLPKPPTPCEPVPGEGPEMVIIPGGTFEMGDIQGTGDAREKPVHTVRVKTFAIGRCEVTFAEFDAFAQATGRELPDDGGWGRESRPVILVSWEDVAAYTEWLSEQTGKRYRLPTEAEWEYAARAGTDTDYWWGQAVQQDGQIRANCDGCGSEWDNKQTAPVGRFAANPFGLHDTVGNVWEWVQDCWHDNYEGARDDASAWLEANSGDCALRVIRGGSWYFDPGYVRASGRSGSPPDSRYDYLGFRLAQDLD